MFGSLGLTSQSVAPATLVDDVRDVRELVDAGLTLQSTHGTITSTAGEQNIYINDAPLGSYKCLHLFVDLDLMLAADTIDFRTYYRIAPAGALQLQDYQTYTGIDGGLANSKKLIAIDLYPCRFGAQVTIQRTAGADHAYDWQVFVEN